MERFVEARKLVKRNPEEMLKLCASLLDTENVDVSVMQLMVLC